jgi:hypothetical protein
MHGPTCIIVWANLTPFSLQHATLIQAKGTVVKERYLAEKLDAMAGANPGIYQSLDIKVILMSPCTFH